MLEVQQQIKWKMRHIILFLCMSWVVDKCSSIYCQDIKAQACGFLPISSGCKPPDNWTSVGFIVMSLFTQHVEYLFRMPTLTKKKSKNGTNKSTFLSSISWINDVLSSNTSEMHSFIHAERLLLISKSKHIQTRLWGLWRSRPYTIWVLETLQVPWLQLTSITHS